MENYARHIAFLSLLTESLSKVGLQGKKLKLFNMLHTYIYIYICIYIYTYVSSLNIMYTNVYILHFIRSAYHKYLQYIKMYG